MCSFLCLSFKFNPGLIKIPQKICLNSTAYCNVMFCLISFYEGLPLQLLLRFNLGHNCRWGIKEHKHILHGKHAFFSYLHCVDTYYRELPRKQFWLLCFFGFCMSVFVRPWPTFVFNLGSLHSSFNHYCQFYSHVICAVLLIETIPEREKKQKNFGKTSRKSMRTIVIATTATI